jgi:hypothetical protein
MTIAGVCLAWIKWRIGGTFEAQSKPVWHTLPCVVLTIIIVAYILYTGSIIIRVHLLLSESHLVKVVIARVVKVFFLGVILVVILVIILNVLFLGVILVRPVISIIRLIADVCVWILSQSV